MFERFIGHDGAQVGSADTDVDDIFNPLTAMTLPRTTANLLSEARHFIEHFMDSGNDVFAINNNLFALRCTQRNVEYGAVLGDVDLLAGKHRLNAGLESGFFGELKQQLERLISQAILGVIEEDAAELCREPITTRRVPGEQVFQGHVLHLAVVGGECLPGGTLCQRLCFRDRWGGC